MVGTFKSQKRQSRIVIFCSGCARGDRFLIGKKKGNDETQTNHETRPATIALLEMNKKRSALRTKTTEQEIGCKRPDHSTNTQKSPNVPHTFETMRSRTGVQRRGNITCDIARSDRLLNRRARKGIIDLRRPPNGSCR